MAKIKLTKAALDKVRSTGRLHFIWDTELPLFGVQVTPAGAISYVISYRIGGESRRKVLGKYQPQLTPENARALAKVELGKVATGTDVAKVASDLRAEAKLSEVIERFLVDHVDAKLKPSTVSEYRRLAKNHIVPALGTKRVSQITRQDTGALHSKAGRAHKRTANLIMAVLSKFFSWYVAAGGTLPDGNPCKSIQKFKEAKRERFLDDAEFARVGKALEEAVQFSRHARAAIVLLIMTGARKQEVLTLKWDYIDLQRGLLFLPDSKTGAKSVPLSRSAAAVLDNLPRIEGNDYVFPGGVEGQPYRQLQKVWAAVRDKAGLDDVRLHDLRHSFGSVAMASGSSLPVLGKALGHSQASTTQRYAHLADNPVRQMVEGVGAKLAGLLGGPTDGKE